MKRKAMMNTLSENDIRILSSDCEHNYVCQICRCDDGRSGDYFITLSSKT